MTSNDISMLTNFIDGWLNDITDPLELLKHVIANPTLIETRRDAIEAALTRMIERRRDGLDKYVSGR